MSRSPKMLWAYWFHVPSETLWQVVPRSRLKRRPLSTESDICIKLIHTAAEPMEGNVPLGDVTDYLSGWIAECNDEVWTPILKDDIGLYMLRSVL